MLLSFSLSLSRTHSAATLSLSLIYTVTRAVELCFGCCSALLPFALSLSLSFARTAPLRCLSLSLTYTSIRAVEQCVCCHVGLPLHSPPLAHACASTLFLEFACPLGCRPRGRRTAFTRRCIRGCCECSYVRVSVWVGVVSSVIIAVGLARWRAPGAEYGCRAYMGALTPGAQYHLPCASSARARACHSAFCFAYRSHSLSLSAVVIVAGMGNFPGVCACVVGSSIPRQNNKTKRKQRINYVQAIARS